MGPPTVQASNLIFSNTAATSTTISWTNGNGASRVVFVHVGASGSAAPLNYFPYTADSVFGSGTEIGSSGWFCVYKGTGTTVNITGLSPLTTYQVMTLEYNGSLGNELHLTTTSTGNPAGFTTIALSNNIATLSNLSLSAGTLNPVFASGTTNYTATVDFYTTGITVTPAATDSNAAITVNGVPVLSGNASGTIALNVGSNIITKIVTATDGIATETYTLTITRLAAGGPPPIITSFSPASGLAGTTVTISGSNFGATIAENTVFFGAVKAVVTAATTTSLTVTVPIEATYQPISVTNTTTVLTGYSATGFISTFTPNKANITTNDIMPKVDFGASSTWNVKIGDFDGDGKVDIASLDGSGTVSIFRNIATSGTINAGSLAPKVDFSAGNSTLGLAVGDLDGDGKLDIAVSNRTSNAVTVLRNTSSGIGNISFAASTSFGTNLNSYDVAIGDIDGDGKADLVAVNYAASTVSVLRNTSSGVGNISFAVKQDFTVGTNPVYVAIGDLDGDGKNDLAVSNLGSGVLSVLGNTSVIGTISFNTKVDFATNSSSGGIMTGDLNKDGKIDLIIGYFGGSVISVFNNTSSGIGNINFDPKIDFPAGSTASSIAIGDLDGDGNVDLAASSRNSGSLSVLRNTSLSGGPISFANKVDFTSASSVYMTAIGDLDGDGKNDIVVANNNGLGISVFRNNPLLAPITQATNVLFNTTTSTSTNVSWTNGNGTSRAVFMYKGASGTPLPVDLTTYTANTAFGTGTQIGTTGWYCIYNGAGTTVNVTGLTPATTYQVMTLEYNGTAGNQMYQTAVSTGNPAAVTTISNIATLSNLSISAGTLTPVFATATTSYTAIVSNAVTSLTLTPTTTNANATVTVNGVAVVSGSPSGAITLAVGSNVITTVVTAQDGTTIGTYTVTVTRSLAPPVITSFNPVNGPAGTTVIITGTDFGPTIAENTVFFGVVQAVVTAATATSLTVTVPVGTTYQSISVTNTTTVLTGYSMIPFTLTFTPNKGTITLDDILPKVNFTAGTVVLSLASGDFDGDGKDDLVSTNAGSNTMSVFRNTAASGTINTGSFASKIDFTTGTAPKGVRAGDFDGDGKLDLAVANLTGTEVSVFRNISTGPGNINFANKVAYTTGTSPSDVAIIDVDGDGKTDLVTSNLDSNSISVLRNISSGIGNINFEPKVDFATSGRTQAIGSADLDGDGKMDIITANLSGAISVLRNTSTVGTVGFATQVSYVIGTSGYNVVIGDFNKDGKPDIAQLLMQVVLMYLFLKIVLQELGILILILK